MKHAAKKVKAQKMRRITMLGWGLLAVVALSWGVYKQQQGRNAVVKEVSLLEGVLLEPSRAIADIKLVANNEELFSNESLKNNWTFLFFGFSKCAHICPMTLVELNKMYKYLQQSQKTTVVPKVVMVTLDPQRDTAAKMQTYVDTFNKNFIGLSGDKKLINAFAEELGIVHMRVEGGKEQYDIDHNASIMLFNPQGKVQAMFSRPHNGAGIAEDFLQVLRNYS